jgi:hypothetical protein
MLIKILGHNYDVVFSGKEYHNSGNTGTVQYFDQTIKIDTNSHPEYQEETVIHEIFEVLRDCFDLREKMDHAMLSQLSEGIYCVIKDNPHVFTINVKGEA